MAKSQAFLNPNKLRCIAIGFSCLAYFLFSVSAHAESSISYTSDDTLKIVMTRSTQRFFLFTDDGTDGQLRYYLNSLELEGPIPTPKHIEIVAWGGEMSISLGQVSIEGNLTIRTGSSRDVISIGDSFIGGKVNIITRGGNDYVSFVNSVAVGRMAINTGTGDDYIPFRDSTLAGSFRLITGDGSDVSTLDNMVFIKNANVYMGIGDDTLISWSNAIYGEHRIVTSSGIDWVYLMDTSIEGELTVKTGADNDLLEMESNFVLKRTLLTDTSGSEDIFEYDGSNTFLGGFSKIGFDILEYIPINQ